MLTEGLEHLSEAQRKLAYHNAALVTANEMAHSGSSKSEIHSWLTDNYQPMYNKAVMRHWYTAGGDVPVVNYVRHHVSKLFGHVKSPHFEGRQIHDNMTNDELLKFVADTHNNSKEIHSGIISPTITLYRGIGNPSDIETYTPHAAESWTTHIDTARKFANLGMGMILRLFHMSSRVKCIEMIFYGRT